jgi:hypothetical protein
MSNNEKTRKKAWGTLTPQVVEAIQNNYTTLRQIADHTGISYRSVNAIINSLELQDRVIAESYEMKRCEQIFKVIRANRQNFFNRGFVEHPKNRTQKSHKSHPIFPFALDRHIQHQKKYTSGSVLVHRLI